jgi:integrase
VWAILDQVTIPVYRVCLTTIYSCGLRLLEGATLEIPQIDSARMQLHISGKGGCDRLVPLPEATLQMMRDRWRTHRSPIWLFPATTRKGLKHHLTAIGKPPRPPKTDRCAVHDTRPRCPYCGTVSRDPPCEITRSRAPP